ncbi:lipoprotein-anchoring transpeptidase ErfK/SrfK [Aeromicrobium panaciterrae]|uniref:Lipoprotein-anchoring transpeptidase ErfK/SrfK n=1 Tax=Aeromicrobium panaciterrae TaxID=363861 RepID=A0ABU1UM74_9ACTN|nr:L,D-transpeptidase [Aeromicrobium panaciterrae]MDR7086276.1 lipoprotein-anchoring transpeptidase ErfK/SrfK [Aeromicrobium panaciterrae]
MSKHRAQHRAPRRKGRIAAVVLALGLTAGAGSAAAMGVIPQLQTPEPATASDALAPAAIETASLEKLEIPKPKVTPAAQTVEAAPDAATLPAGSGTGYRIVFDQSDQRVWLVESDGSVERTYLVSGSKFNNLQPGSYQVQSKSRTANAFDGSGTMEYFVRFATGFSEPIGFHSVPKDHSGQLEQTKEQLGTRLSAGCVRQWLPDAIALWDFAPIGTRVVVTA